MKKAVIALLLVSLALGASAADLGEFSLDGEVKSGFLWEKNEKIAKDPETKVSLNNQDDAGTGQGRIRINFGYVNGNVGIKARLQWDDWQNTQKAPEWPYLFGYINSFGDQLTISMGKLGGSSWGTGGPEKWKELEAMSAGGVRVEYKPDIAAVPWLTGLNVGFVLNWYDGSLDRGAGREVSLLDLLRESVIGVSYEHKYFLARFAYRLDSEIDQRPGSFASGREGDDLIYRIEERYLQTLLPGFQIWALGVYEGVGAEFKECIKFENWLFVQYAPELFTAQVRLGYDVVETRSLLHVKPSFYLNLFDNFLNVGASFYYVNDFGADRVNKDAPYTEILLEPLVKLNFKNAYVAFAYRYRQTYLAKTRWADPPIEQFQTMNLRFGMVF